MSGVELTQPLIVGRVSGVYGVKGWVKLHSHTDPRENILTYKNVWIKNGEKWEATEIVQGRPQAQTVVAQLAGYDDREKVRELIGRDIAIDVSQLPKTGDGYYWRDLIGLSVINGDNVTLGTVDTLMETGANDVLVLKDSQGQECLVPFVMGEFVKQVDLDSGVITVDWPENF